MQMNFSIFFVSALIAITFGQEDGKQYCQSAIQCYVEAEKLNSDCQATNKPSNTSVSANKSTDCKAVLNDKIDQLRQKEKQHRQQMIDCLKTRVDDATPVPQKEAVKCQNASTPASGMGPSQRFVRQTTNMTDVSSTDMSSGQGGSGSGSDGGSAANVGSSGNGATANGGSGSGGGQGNKGKGKGGKGGKGSGNGPNKPKPQGNNVCQQKVQQKQAQCKKMDTCCSEIPYCHLQFELSDLHDQIRQLELDILLQRRKCQAQQPQQTHGTKAPPQKPLGPMGNNITRV